jgi:hypothetical protein
MGILARNRERRDRADSGEFLARRDGRVVDGGGLENGRIGCDVAVIFCRYFGGLKSSRLGHNRRALSSVRVKPDNRSRERSYHFSKTRPLSPRPVTLRRHVIGECRHVAAARTANEIADELL